MLKQRAKMLPALAVIWIVSLVAMVLLQKVEPSLWMRETQLIPGYEVFLSGGYDTVFGKILYILGNWTECHGLMCWLAGLVMILSGVAVHAYLRANKDKEGIKMYPPAGPGGGYLGMIASGFIGLIVANLVWGFEFDVAAGVTYIPVFIVCCAVPQAITLSYGNDWKVWVTAGVICGLLQYPLEKVCFSAASMLGLPPLILFTVIVVGIGGIICFEIYKLCPWVKKFITNPETRKVTPYVQTDCAPKATSGWLTRRMFADWTEIMFFGNEWIGVATLIALLLSWFLNPWSTVYATPNLVPGMVAASFLASSLALFIYQPKYAERGFFNTFCVPTTALLIFLFYGMAGVPAALSVPLVIIASVLIAFVAPLVCDRVAAFLGSILSKRYDAVVLAVLVNAPSIGVTVFVCFLMVAGLISTGLFV